MSSIETATKLATYWYLTPVRLHRGHPTRSPDCWRDCQAPGTLTHLLWECPLLNAYWQQILDDIDLHFETQLPRFPDYVLLGLPNAITFPLTSKRGCQKALALGAAVQNILTHWGTKTLPTRLGWLHRLWALIGMEKISLSLTNPGASFHDLWEPFLKLLTSEFTKLTCPKYLRLLRLADPPTPRVGQDINHDLDES